MTTISFYYILQYVAGITHEKYFIKEPVFFGAADHDCVCIPAIGEQIVKKYCPNPTIYHYNTDHWIPLAAPDQLNNDLLEWIGKLHPI